ncbi:unnamed protein product [Cuscuta epithymum]|uniref:rRNA methyltransferase 2, mitochondrial n=1 Tax=Cuscuta epithymum TaxID=186058 RepID=A0AAV0FYV4_9ASTE|nr:unnamed protein product [Cuscuta epithymum]CAH9140765.1 unnamed protein product [Cuscuta epithymum]
MHCDSRVQTVCGNVMELPREKIKDLSPQKKGFSVILSDMCPLVSGITTRDSVLSAELGHRALDLAVGGDAFSSPCTNPQVDGELNDIGDNGILQLGGHLVIKLLESEDTKGNHFSVFTFSPKYQIIHFLEKSGYSLFLTPFFLF